MSKNNPDKVQAALRTAAQLSDKVDESKVEQTTVQDSHDTQLAPETALESVEEASVGAAVETQRPVANVNGSFDQYDEVSPLAKSLVLQWDAYVKAANPANRQTTTSLLALQTTLANLVTSTYNLDNDDDFIVVFGRVMQLVRDNPNRVFGAEAIFRGFSSLGLSDKKVNALRLAIDAILIFSDPAGRKNALRYYNLQQSASICRTMPARERFIGYITRISE